MSTLETAITFSLILILLTIMITGPEAIALDSFDCAKAGGDELFYMEKDEEIFKKNPVNGNDCYDVSPEKLCTFLTGVSDNFRLIYGTVHNFPGEASDEEE